MEKIDFLKNVPKEGFLKTTGFRNEDLSSQQRAHLARKGNELFNSGEYEQARRVFLTIGYTDGLIRLGDHYMSQNRLYEALRMYKAAPAQDKIEALAEKMSHVIRNWLSEAQNVS